MIFQKLKKYISYISIDCVMACIYFLSLPFTVVTTPFGSLMKIITMPVTAVLLYKLIFGKTKPLAFNSVHLVYSVYVLYTVCGLFFLMNDMSVLHTKDMLLTYFVMTLISIRVYNDKEIDLIESSWVLVGVYCAYLALTSTEVANEFENRTIVYVLGFREDPNQFCAYFIMPVMICIKRIVEKRKFTLLYIVLLILIMYSVLRTGSRGGFLGIIIGIVMCIFLAVKSFKAKIALIMIGILSAIIIMTVVFPLLPEDVQVRFSVESVVEDNGAGRFDIWKYLFNYSLEKPERFLLGSGLFSTYTILEEAKVVDKAGAAHNQFVQVLTDQGVIGVVLFLTLIATCFFRSWKRNPYYACAFVAVMVFSMSLTLYLFKPYINILIMCAITYIMQEGENHGDNQKVIELS
ncbi:MAG: O-antigen ligase family protein [Eubacteriales bacterium]|nr:O-antigen ligase family protein [Eubacteriales bacterium]